MKPNEAKFLEMAVLRNMIKGSDSIRIKELHEKSGLPLFAMLVKERILTIEQVSFIQKSLLEKSMDEKKTIPQATQSLEGELTLAQDQSPKSIEEKKTLGQENDVLAQEQKQKQKPCLDNKKQFGRYTILENLGEGGMGVVYKAYDPSLDRIVALKLITAARQQSKISIERFLIEAKATAKLSHEHIIKIHDMGEENGIYFFTMELIQGTTLESLIKEKKISRQNSLKLLIKVCRAIDYAHSNGIVHRDMKPGNIMVDAAHEPRVMDFGLAKLDKEDKKLSRTGAPIGTPAYMSPEQAHGKDIGHLSDVYSLGAILYTILTGIEPFRGDTLLKILEAVKEKEPVAPTLIKPGLSRDLEIICQKAMSKEQERRYSSARDLAQDLENFLEGDPISARPASFLYRYSRKLLKNKVVSFLIFLCFLLAFGGFLFFWQQQSKRFQKVQETIQKNFTKAESFSFSKDRQGRLDERTIKKMYEAVQFYSVALDSVQSSEYTSQLASIQKEMQQKRDSALAILYENALSCYNGRLCQRALDLYQGVRNILYNVKETKISKEKIDAEISDLYRWILAAEKAKDQAKSIAYNNHSSREDIEKAIVLLHESLEKNQENADAFYLRGLLYFRISQKQKAIENFSQCLALESDHFPSKYYSIKLSVKKYLRSSELQKELNDYIEKFAPVLENYSKENKTYFYLIQAYYLKLKHNRYEAEQKIILAQKESPLLAESYYTQANFLSYFLTGEESVDFDWDSFLETVSVFYNYERANKAIQRGLELDPNNHLGLLLQGKLAWDVFDTQKAIDNFSRLIHEQPDAYLYFLRACAYLDLGKKDMALADFYALREKFQVSNTMVDCILCLLLEEAGKTQESDKILERWEKERFKIDNESFQKNIKIFFNAQEEFKILDHYSSKDTILALQIPFLFLCLKMNKEKEIFSDIPDNIVSEKPNAQIVLLFLKDYRKYVQIMMERDIFQAQNLIHDFYFLDEIKKFNRYQDTPGNNPTEMYFGSVLHFILQYSLKKENFSKRINHIFEKKLKTFQAEILVAFSIRANILRQQYLLCRQDTLQFAESYYHRSMYFFPKRKWDKAIEDMKMALHLSQKEKKYHYAFAKILAYQMLETPQKKENRERILYHLEQAYSMGLQPLEMPLEDPAFYKFREAISLIIKRYESYANRALWKELWDCQKEKRYNTIYNFTKDLPINTSVMPFISSIESEEASQYHYTINKLISDKEKGKSIINDSENAEKAFSPYWQEKIQEKTKDIELGNSKKIRVALDNTGHFQDIQKAIDIASEGTTIELAPGIYEGSFVLKRGITLCGSLDDKGLPSSILRNPLKGIAIAAIEMKNIKILNCEIQSDIYLRHSEISLFHCSLKSTNNLPGSKVFEIFVYGNSQLNIEKSHIRAALRCFDQSHLVLKDSLFSYCFELRINFYDSSTAWIQGNDMSKDFSGTGSYILFLHDQSQAVVYQNKIHHASIGIHLTDNAQAEIKENKIYQTKTGIFVDKNARCSLVQNEIYQNLEYGISIPKKASIALDGNIFRENTKGDLEKRD